MKKEQGITLIALIITIIILVILASIGASSGIATIKSSKYIEFTTELKLLQSEVNAIYQSSEKYEINENLKVTNSLANDLNSILENENIKMILNNRKITITANEFEYWTKEYISEKFNIDVNRNYFINVPNRLIISSKPFLYNKENYYIIDQIEDGYYNVDYNNTNSTNGKFDVKVTQDGNKYKVEVLNIQYEGYINNWQVKYKSQYSKNWRTSNNLTFYLDTSGVYDIKLVHDEIELDTAQFKIEKLSDKIRIGDYIDYSPDVVSEGYLLQASHSGYTSDQTIVQDSAMKWQVLRIYDDESIDIIGTIGSTQPAYYLRSATGYNNGVYLMNDMCKNLYSKTINGKTYEARSINLEDTEYWLGKSEKNADGIATGIAARDSYRKNTISKLQIDNVITNINNENNTVTYIAEKSYYPNLYESEIESGINASDSSKLDLSSPAYKQAKDSGLTIPENFYNIAVNDSNYGEGAKVLDSSYVYGIATRRYSNSQIRGVFGIYQISNHMISGLGLFCSNQTEVYDVGYRLRPVVHLEEGVKIQFSDNAINSDTPHQIIEY